MVQTLGNNGRQEATETNMANKNQLKKCETDQEKYGIMKWQNV